VNKVIFFVLSFIVLSHQIACQQLNTSNDEVGSKILFESIHANGSSEVVKLLAYGGIVRQIIIFPDGSIRQWQGNEAKVTQGHLAHYREVAFELYKNDLAIQLPRSRSTSIDVVTASVSPKTGKRASYNTNGLVRYLNSSYSEEGAKIMHGDGFTMHTYPSGIVRKEFADNTVTVKHPQGAFLERKLNGEISATEIRFDGSNK